MLFSTYEENVLFCHYLTRLRGTGIHMGYNTNGEELGMPKTTHGTRALQRTWQELAARGVDPLDGRTRVAKHLQTMKEDLVTALGGDITPQQDHVIDMVIRSRCLIDSLDYWLFKQPDLVIANKKTGLKQVQQVVKDRSNLVNSLLHSLNMLGLERKSKPVNAQWTKVLEDVSQSAQNHPTNDSKPSQGNSEGVSLDPGGWS